MLTQHSSRQAYGSTCSPLVVLNPIPLHIHRRRLLEHQDRSIRIKHLMLGARMSTNIISIPTSRNNINITHRTRR